MLLMAAVLEVLDDIESRNNSSKNRAGNRNEGTGSERKRQAKKSDEVASLHRVVLVIGFSLYLGCSYPYITLIVLLAALLIYYIMKWQDKE